MNSSLNREEWMDETMRFLQERSILEGGIGGPAVGLMLEDEEVYYSAGAAETDEEAFLRAVAEAQREEQGEAERSVRADEHERMGRTTMSGFRLPVIRAPQRTV